jgi:hypothetical protein
MSLLRPRRVLASYAAASDYSPVARVLLAKLGYRIVPVEEMEAGALPDLRLVHERRLDEVPSESSDGTRIPIILLTGRWGVRGEDRRVMGAVHRPAGLHELYRLCQSLLEENPRSVPRISTRLPARCRREGRDWTGTVLTLSENGCLLSLAEMPPLDAVFELGIALPDRGPAETRAVATYQEGSNLGLVFHGTSPAFRKLIADYVSETLARS